MTIGQAIDGARQGRGAGVLLHDDLTEAQLVKLLSDLDGLLWCEVACHYEGAPAQMPSYPWETEEDVTAQRSTVLMVAAPWDGMYLDYLAMNIDLRHGDFERYNNEAALFGAKRNGWAAELCRTSHWARSAPFIRF